MTIRMHLPKYLPDCPQAWRNLIADMQSRVKPDDVGGFTTETIQKEVEQYRAVFNGRNLVFEDERMYNLFMLKYSEVKEYN